MFMNANFKDSKKVPEDLIKLSFDVDTPEEKPTTFKEAKQQLGSKFKR